MCFSAVDQLHNYDYEGLILQVRSSAFVCLRTPLYAFVCLRHYVEKSRLNDHLWGEPRSNFPTNFSNLSRPRRELKPNRAGIYMTGVEASKVFGPTKIVGTGMAITDEIIGFSQLLGARARAAPPGLRLWPGWSFG